MRVFVAFGVIVVLLTAACSEGASPPEKLVPAQLIKVAGDTQVALVGTALSLTPTVEARTSSGVPVPGVAVIFAVVEGGGAVSAQSVTTDASGHATTTWTLGTVAGSQRLRATGENVSPVDFTALAAAQAATIAAATPQQIAGLVSTAFTLGVIARNASEAAQRDAVVLFAVANGAGTLGASQAITSANGNAQTTFTAAAAGTNNVTARLVGVNGADGMVTFAMNAVSSVTLAAVGSESFSATGGDRRTITLGATSGGSALANLPVSFSLTSGGGTLEGSSTMTNAAGEASTSWTMPLSSGTHRVTVSGGGQSVTFTASVTYDPNQPTKLTPQSGDSVYVQPGATQSITVKATNAANNGLSGVAVTFRAITPGSSVSTTLAGTYSSSVVVTTGSAGNTLAYFKVGTSVGTYVATAEVPSVPSATFRVYAANPGAPSRLERRDGSGAAVPATTTAIISPSVRVADANGVPVPDVNVTWTVTTGSGLVRTLVPPAEGQSVTMPSNSFGVSAAGFRAGPTPETNTITASVPGVTPVTFTIKSTTLATCSNIASYTLGTTINGFLSSNDCPGFVDAGPPYLPFYVEPHRATLTQTQALEVLMTAAFVPKVWATTETRSLAANVRTGTAMLRLILPPGTYYFGAGSDDQATTGDYTLMSTLNADVSSGSNIPLTMRGIDATLSVRTSSSFSNAPYNAMAADIFLWTGEQITVDMRSANFDAYLGLWDRDKASWVATDDNSGGGTNARITFTAPRPGFYGIYAGTATTAVPANRQFTLTIQ